MFGYLQTKVSVLQPCLCAEFVVTFLSRPAGIFLFLIFADENRNFKPKHAVFPTLNKCKTISTALSQEKIENLTEHLLSFGFLSNTYC